MSFIKKAIDFISRPTQSRTMGMVVMLVLVAAVSLTVIVAQQQQSIRQRAAGNLPPPISTDECKMNCLIDNQITCGFKLPITDDNREEQINNCDPLGKCIQNGCPQVVFYSDTILKATDLNMLEEYRTGMENNYVKTGTLTYNQYKMLHDQYYTPKRKQLTELQQPTSPPAPTKPAQQETVHIQGKYVDVDGKELTQDIGQQTKIENGQEISGTGSWTLGSLSPSDYTVIAVIPKGYSVSYSYSGKNTNPTTAYTAGSSVTVSLPNNGDWADIYFKYTPILAPGDPAQAPGQCPAPTNFSCSISGSQIRGDWTKIATDYGSPNYLFQACPSIGSCTDSSETLEEFNYISGLTKGTLYTLSAKVSSGTNKCTTPSSWSNPSQCIIPVPTVPTAQECETKWQGFCSNFSCDTRYYTTLDKKYGCDPNEYCCVLIAAAVPTPAPVNNVLLVLALNAQDVPIAPDSLPVKLVLYNLTTNTQVPGAPATQSFGKVPIPGKQYSANISLTNLQQNSYFLVARKDNMIAKAKFTVAKANETITVPTATLVFGDINNDSDINTLDYNAFRDCWKKTAADSCDSSDFDKNGAINQFDYNTYLRGFAAWIKQGK